MGTVNRLQRRELLDRTASLERLLVAAQDLVAEAYSLLMQIRQALLDQDNVDQQLDDLTREVNGH